MKTKGYSATTEIASTEATATEGVATARGSSCCEQSTSNLSNKRGSRCQSAENARIEPSITATKRQKVLHVRPWPESTDPPSDLAQLSDHCHCAPGACTCVGCSDHPQNEATMKVVEELWQAQFLECFQEEGIQAPPSKYEYA